MKIFSPIVHLLNKMKYSHKFLMIGFILLAPLLLVSWFYLKTLWNDMDQISKRVEGANYNVVLKDILQYTQQTRGLNVTVVSGDESVKGTLEETTKKVDEALQNAQSMESEMAFNFETSEKLNDIQTKWNELQQITWNNSADILSEYALLTAEIIELMGEVTNNSELLLAESKEEFNLLYNTSMKLPSLTEQFGQIRAIGTDILNHNTFTEAEMAKIDAIYFPMLNSIEEMKGMMAISFNDEEIAGSLQSHYTSLLESTDVYLKAIETLEDGKMSSKDYFGLATSTIDANYNFYTESLENLVSYLETEYSDLENKVAILSIVLVFIIILALFLFIGLYVAIRQSIKSLEKATSEIANGNLGVKVALNTKDEMQNIEVAFNSMTQQLNDLVREISISAEHVSSSSEELHASADEATLAVEHSTNAATQMALDSEHQTASLKESAQAMDEMALGIEKIAENSARVSALTSDTTVLANDGNSTVKKAYTQMEIIKDTVLKSSEQVQQLNKQSVEIDTIVKVITEIADQTNLLALNAAIEAARAGEHGKGFAVVADEVKKLAEQSRGSAEQIAELIHTIQSGTITSVQMMNQVNDNVDVGMKVTEETANSFDKILNSMHLLNPQMEEISSTAIEFSAQTEQVVSAIQVILTMAQKTTEATEEIASSSEEQLAIMEEISTSANSLSKMAESLQKLVMQFKL